MKDIHFDFDQYDLTEEARKILNEDAKVIVGSSHPHYTDRGAL